MFQDLSNGVLGVQFGVCFHFQPRFQTFATCAQVQFPKWECIWESFDFIPYTLPHCENVFQTKHTLGLMGPYTSHLVANPMLKL
jgi:hypothetical protein